MLPSKNGLCQTCKVMRRAHYYTPLWGIPFTLDNQSMEQLRQVEALDVTYSHAASELSPCEIIRWGENDSLLYIKIHTVQHKSKLFCLTKKLLLQTSACKSTEGTVNFYKFKCGRVSLSQAYSRLITVSMSQSIEI